MPSGKLVAAFEAAGRLYDEGFTLVLQRSRDVLDMSRDVAFGDAHELRDLSRAHGSVEQSPVYALAQRGFPRRGHRRSGRHGGALYHGL